MSLKRNGKELQIHLTTQNRWRFSLDDMLGETQQEKEEREAFESSQNPNDRQVTRFSPLQSSEHSKVTSPSSPTKKSRGNSANSTKMENSSLLSTSLRANQRSPNAKQQAKSADSLHSLYGDKSSKNITPIFPHINNKN